MKKSNQLFVIKLGSASLTQAAGDISAEKIARITDQIAEIKGAGHQVVVVTSGAVAAGFRRLGYPGRPRDVAAKQASAAVGQGLLMEEYTANLLKRGYIVAQLLLTRSDFTDRRRYRNAFNTMTTLLKRGAIPIVNENDTVSIEELKFGDNDMLSAQLAALLHADLLILLTDVDGLYTADPNTDPSARRVDRVAHIDAAVEKLASDTKKSVGTGGMVSKIAAARLATSSGVPVLICSAGRDGVLVAAARGETEGTFFSARPRGMNTRMQWLAFYSDIKGAVTIDDGAVAAVRKRNTSLLPSGVLTIEGEFAEGDAIEVFDANQRLIGRGLSQVSSGQLAKIKGLSSGEIERLMPGVGPEVIHRDDWLAAERIHGEE